MPDIDLHVNIYSNKFWSQLFRVINTSYHLAYVSYEDSTYINKYYDNEEGEEEYIEKMEVNASKLIYTYLGHFIHEDVDEETHAIIKTIAEMKCRPEEIMFVSPENVIIRNRCGFNDDDRGSDNIPIRLPFHFTPLKI